MKRTSSVLAAFAVCLLAGARSADAKLSASITSTRVIASDVTRPGLRAPTGVSILTGPCPYGEASACTDGVRVWLDPALTDELRDFTLSHEFGHVADRQYLDDGERQRLERLMRLTGPWGVVAVERFADAYALCALGWEVDGNVWLVGASGYSPTRLQYRRVCATTRRALQDY